MRTDLIQLSESIDSIAAARLASALQAIPGLEKVSISTTANNVKVEFDEDLTSTQELRMAIACAGLKSVPKSHAGGSCCGSCGGQ